ncbi:hypothetical protein SAMN04488688_104401 [Paenibacillus sp. cl141a]|nr:hypothetical protein SAMN04488688_104401 [Paenibacillus sp. cl141a]
MNGIIIVTGIYIPDFFYLFINTPLKYALIITALLVSVVDLPRNSEPMPPKIH